MEIEKYQFSELFTCEIQNDKNFPFDHDFKTIAEPKAIMGPGIYLIAHGDQVLYIGSHAKGNDIIKDRWSKHIHTITNRGSRVGFGKNSEKKFNDKILPLFHKRGVRLNIQDIKRNRLKDTGVVTSVNRIIYVLNNNLFMSKKPKFEHIYFYLFKLNKGQVSKIKAVELDIIHKLNPPCNFQFKKSKDVPRLNEALRYINRIIPK